MMTGVTIDGAHSLTRGKPVPSSSAASPASPADGGAEGAGAPSAGQPAILASRDAAAAE